MKKAITILVVVIVVAAGVFYWKSRPSLAPTTSATPSASATQSASDATYVAGNLLLGTDANSSLGTYIIAYNGMTLYTYAKDTIGKSNCTGTCAVNWPPYIVSSRAPIANIQAGISGSVDTTTRADGSLQVTYKGMPLYFYIKDKKSGDTTGQNVGGVWFVVKP